jgi:carbon monoxide dehydrogenase subunit G
MISVSTSIEIAATPAQVFALIDNLQNTPLWLERCVKVELGDPILYYFRQYKDQVGCMTAQITTRVVDQKLTLKLQDKYANVTIEQLVKPAIVGGSNGTLLTCSIDVAFRTLAGKLVSPFIRKHLPTALATAAERVKAQVEG